MYIKIFENRDSNKSYSIVYPFSLQGHLEPYIENEKHETIGVPDNELFDLIDRFFKEKMQSQSK
jgi:hypothetical protein